jgi:hypothetical protein
VPAVDESCYPVFPLHVLILLKADNNAMDFKCESNYLQNNERYVTVLPVW